MKKLPFLLLFFAALTYAQDPTVGEVGIYEDDVEDVPFSVVEEVPVFPGCSGSRAEKKKCLEQKMLTHVAKHFNSDLGKCLKYEFFFDKKEKVEKTKCVKSLRSGKHSLMAMFIINKKGNIEGLKVRAPHSALKKEVRRIVGKIPKMQPGKQRGKPVEVKYVLPIFFVVD